MSKITEEEIKKFLPLKGPSFEEVKNYLEKYNDEYIVIKCGGSVLVDQNLFNNFINDISILNKLGFIPVLIHGGGKRISNKLNEAGIKSDFINGLRVTDEKSINVVEGVLSDFNTEITDALKKNGCNSQGVTNKQNNILLVEQENQKLGFVGTPKKIDQSVIEQIVKEKKVPVIAPLGLDENNQVFNINADTAAGAIAKKLNARRRLLVMNL
ncbi:acetylglutamate kinase [Pelagibacterales bacterium SAG-MED24]|nr:acetylglutamate kinase [Pelagibacterales bacterium SAG-MED24]